MHYSFYIVQRVYNIYLPFGDNMIFREIYIFMNL